MFFFFFLQVARLERELGYRVMQARLQGQEAAELKKSGEISVLESELGSTSKWVWLLVTSQGLQ